MRKIHKYPLMPPFIVHAPRDTKWLHVGKQNVEGRDLPFIWAEVEDAGFNVRNTFSVIGTGHEVPEHTERHIGTIEMEGGQIILHVYQDKFEGVN